MSTRTDLILAAERLFAVHGVDAVSLRRISTEAGQRNVAAAQYHFQDKQALIRAVVEVRGAQVTHRRNELLDRIGTDGIRPDVRALVRPFVVPLAEQATVPGSHYLRFLDRLCDHLGQVVVPHANGDGPDGRRGVGALDFARPVLTSPDPPRGARRRRLTSSEFGTRLKRIGLHPRQDRSTALFTLATEVPAAILARMLGIHIQVAVQWQRATAGDWAAYAADVSSRTIDKER
ncbi:TetR/AcrR family transcriptional regulator [Yinghuangia sp. YIM S09857]|uniref:TetR/AcrR family transcriptional regulator n=1 Tax=Yinghuangia sp. YIM S09857 TaxID=3436929 RepID=UPI003F52EE88